MPHFHIKKEKGRPYLYVREIARVNGKPKASQTVLGACPAGQEQGRGRHYLRQIGLGLLAAPY